MQYSLVKLYFTEENRRLKLEFICLLTYFLNK